MAIKMDISIVIPTYNEEENLKTLHKELSVALSSLDKSYEIIFVDDGSDDSTPAILKALADQDDHIVIITFRKNFGQTAAFDAGFKNARGKIILSMDADLQNDPSDIPMFITSLNDGYDVVCGWRHNRKDTFLKRITSKAAKGVRNIIAKDDIHDSGCSLRAYRDYALQDLDIYGEMHRFIPTILLWKGFKVGEVKVNHRPRIHGTSKYGFTRIIKGLLDLFIVKFWQQYSARPIHLFGGTGLIFSISGLGLGLLLAVGKIFYGISLANRTSPLLAVLLVILGLQFLLFGIIADIAIKTYYKGKQKNYTIASIRRKNE